MLNRYLERLANLDYKTREQQRVKIVIGITLVALVMSLLITFAILLVTGNEMQPIIFIIAAVAPALISPLTSWHVVNLIIRVQKLEEQHRKLATIDDLTGLLTRRAMLDQGEALLKLCQRNRQPFALAIQDLDKFKAVNDQYGHAGGDAVLKTFAAIMRRDMRASDLVGRLGGEEFAMALPGTSAEDAVHLLERVRLDTAAAKVTYLEHRIQFTTSVGLAGARGLMVENFASLLKRADDALYQAKEHGRNQVVPTGLEMSGLH